MSLILEALRKLEREKKVPERGFLVMSRTHWSAQDSPSSTKRLWGTVVAVSLGLGLVAGWWFQRGIRLSEAQTKDTIRLIQPPPLAPSQPETQIVEKNDKELPFQNKSVQNEDFANHGVFPQSLPSLPPPQQVTPREDPPQVSSRYKGSKIPARATLPSSGEQNRVNPGSEESRDKVEPKDTIQLQAISQRDGRPVAVLNDRMVLEGDRFHGIHVIRIGEAEVEVEIQGHRRIIQF